MLKLILCVGLVVLGAGGGLYCSRRYAARVRQLEKCDAFLIRLETYLDMERITTRELFERMAESESFSELTFLRYTAAELSRNINFPAVWEKGLAECRGELALVGEDYPPLMALGELIGAYDVTAQKNGIEVSRALLQEQLENAQEKYRQNGQLARSLGTLFGIAAAILIF